MASVLAMLEERESAARVRVEGLREEVARLAGALEAAETTAMTETEAEQKTVLAPAPVPGSIVALWREGLPVTVLAPDYQRILDVLDERQSAGQGPLKAREITVELGLRTTSAKVEGVRSSRGYARRPGAWRSAGGSCRRRRGCSAPAGGPWRCQTPPHPR